MKSKEPNIEYLLEKYKLFSTHIVCPEWKDILNVWANRPVIKIHKGLTGYALKSARRNNDLVIIANYILNGDSEYSKDRIKYWNSKLN